MKRTDCANAEILAGAIALGEAGETERDEYRRHIATCEGCLDAFGGEREIERVMATVAQARDEESWEPDLRAALRDRSRYRRAAWSVGFASAGSALAAAFVVSIGLHAFVASNVKPVPIVADQVAAATEPAFKVSLDPRPHPAAPAGHAKITAPVAPLANPVPVPVVKNENAAHTSAPRPVTVVHNVAKPVQSESLGGAQKPSAHDESQIAALEAAQTTAPTYQHQAESIAMAPRELTIREASLAAGSKISPEIPMIAARELNAEGLDAATTVYVVAIDDRGLPTSCTIERPSGILGLDDAVCRAAMKAHFSPRTVNGRPVGGTYRDAFVFLSN